MHYALHIALQSRHSNPRTATTYVDEDFMHLVKLVGEACAAGTPAQQMGLKLVEKYAVGMDFRAFSPFD